MNEDPNELFQELLAYYDEWIPGDEFVPSDWFVDRLKHTIDTDLEPWVVGSDSADIARIIRFSNRSRHDLEETAFVAEIAWDAEIRDKYLEYLHLSIVSLASGTVKGEPFKPLPGWHAYAAVMFREKEAGEIIVYQETEEGISIAEFIRLSGPRIPPDPLEPIYQAHVVGPS